MKPRTREEKEIWQLYEPIAGKVSATFREWIKDVGVRKEKAPAYLASSATKERWCPYCGQSFIPSSNKPKTTVCCPHCHAKATIPEEKYRYHHDGTKTKVRESSIKTFKQLTIVEKFEVHGSRQVDRVYFADFICTKGKPIEMARMFEAFAHWINPQTGTHKVLGRALTFCPHTARIPFTVYGEDLMTFKQVPQNTSYWYSGWRTSLYPRKTIHPSYDYSLKYIPRGIKLDYSEVFEILGTPKGRTIVETLSKIGDNYLLRQYLDNYTNRQKITKYWQSFVVAKRHGLSWKGVSVGDYLDYLTQLDRLGLDLRSPHYLVPKDFIGEHNRLTQRLMSAEERERERERLQRDLAKLTDAMKKEMGFKKRVGVFFGLCLTDGDLRIEPLKSIEEFFDEAKAMHHCVFSMGYYDKKDTLILSAKDKFGNKVETIELNTKYWKIVQSRGVCNSQTAYHEQIINLINKNIGQFKECQRQRRGLLTTA